MKKPKLIRISTEAPDLFGAFYFLHNDVDLHLRCMNFNPWHNAPTGPDAPKIVNAVVEISKDSKAKYEIDKETGMLKLDRVLFAAFTYPVNYRFIPQTLGDDHDPLDILVLSQVSHRAVVSGEFRLFPRDAHDP